MGFQRSAARALREPNRISLGDLPWHCHHHVHVANRGQVLGVDHVRLNQDPLPPEDFFNR